MRIHQNRIDLSRGRAGENEGGPYPGTSGVAAMDVKWTATALAGGGRVVRRRRDAPLGFGQAGAHVLPRRNVGPAEPGRWWSAVASRGGAPHQVEADRVELQRRGVRGGVGRSSGGATSGREEGSRRAVAARCRRRRRRRKLRRSAGWERRRWEKCREASGLGDGKWRG